MNTILPPTYRFRYHVLSRFGGLYVDTDIVPLRTLPQEMLESPFTVCETPRTYDPSVEGSPRCEVACTAVIASPKGNDEIREVAFDAVKRTEARVKEYGKNAPYETELTGPRYWSKTATLESSSFKVLPPKTFYPCDWKDTSECVKENFINDTGVIAMHIWEHSWKLDAKIGTPENGKRSQVGGDSMEAVDSVSKFLIDHISTLYVLITDVHMF